MNRREPELSVRATTILSRFPRHLDLTREDKVFARMVEALARELDIKTMQTGRVRTAHRLGQAEEVRDLLLLAGLHDLQPIHFEIARLRHADSTFPTWLAALRHQIRELIRIHHAGNATVRTLLEAAAAYLCLRVNHIKSNGEFRHTAQCTDLVDPPDAEQKESADSDTLVLEENPGREGAVGWEDCTYGSDRTILYRGVDPALVNVCITGIGERTCFPMVVDTRRGCGLYYAGIVGDGEELEFTDDGRVLLNGAPADDRALSFSGAVFAGKGSSTAGPAEFAFCTEKGDTPHGQAGVFVTTKPASSGFADDAMPHKGGAVDPLILTMGETHLRFFVRIAHFGVRRGDAPDDEDACPSYGAGQYDASLFGEIDHTKPIFAAEFSWWERESFALRLLLPKRFTPRDAASDTMAKRLALLLERHRAAGVKLEVKYAQ
ncbi:MAG: hypothetical protein ACOX5Z_02500 [Desulfobulbus sp.]|jgi:hypothetical protein